jgi:hypothetical protein
VTAKVPKADLPVPKQTPRWLTALGRRDLPQKVEVEGSSCTFRRVFKNDFFAVTALYEGGGGKFILKVGRRAWLGPMPLAWIGRCLAAKEEACLRHLADLEGVPRFVGRWGPCGVIREYIDGHALKKGERVDEKFHDRLEELVRAIHRRQMAYVDLEKCENVLVGENGRPYLFDFQIAWYWPRRWGGDLWPVRWLRRRFQQADRYHLLKIKRRTRPDLLSPEALEASYRKPWYVRAHGLIVRPFTLGRRWFLGKVDPARRGSGERGQVEDEKLPDQNARM